MKFTRRDFFKGLYAAPVAAVTLAPAWKMFVEDTGYWWEDITVLIKRFLKFGKWGWGEDSECPTAIPDDQGGGDRKWDVKPEKGFIYQELSLKKINLKNLKLLNVDASKLRLDDFDARKIACGTIDASKITTETEEHDPWELAYER